MSKFSLHKALLEECSMPSALEIFGERWSFLILRSTFDGMSHFDEMQSTLGIASSTLARRLSRLVEHGLLQRKHDELDGRKVEYSLTIKGRALLPTIVALRQWEEQWMRAGESRLVLIDARDRLPIAPVVVRGADGRALEPGDLEWLDLRA
jgi:DNA-binding HxlR family transcriptional regulator